MPRWFTGLKDGDRVALLLILGGILLVVLGSIATFAAIILLKEEARIDRAIVALAGLGSQGGGLVTAGMGVLKLTSQNTPPSPPAGDAKQDATAITIK
jgi:hypothetical protein